MTNLKQTRLSCGRGFELEFLVAQFGCDPALWCALEIAFHDQVRLIDFLNGVGFLAHGHGEGVNPDRPAAKLGDDGFEDALVHFIEAVFVDFEHGKRLVGDFHAYAAITTDLGEVTDAPEKIVRDARSAATAPGDFTRAIEIDL